VLVLGIVHHVLVVEDSRIGQVRDEGLLLHLGLLSQLQGLGLHCRQANRSRVNLFVPASLRTLLRRFRVTVLRGELIRAEAKASIVLAVLVEARVCVVTLWSHRRLLDRVHFSLYGVARRQRCQFRLNERQTRVERSVEQFARSRAAVA